MDLPCTCGHYRDDHLPDVMALYTGLTCRGNGTGEYRCPCERFEQVPRPVAPPKRWTHLTWGEFIVSIDRQRKPRRIRRLGLSPEEEAEE